MKQKIRSVGLFFALMLGVGAGFSAISAQADEVATPEATPVAVVREVLASSESAEAPDEELALVRYTIAAGAVLPVHTHPGVQMASVVSGTLTYHVVDNGTVPVTRADGTQESFGPGSTITLTVGDSWVEPEGMVHYAENLTSEPVVLISASLFEEGVPTSTIVEATPTS
jgi:quercetin dioxygenase-like cupin family protein